LAMYASDIMTVSISLFLLAKFLSHTSDYMWNRQIVLRIICEIDIFEDLTCAIELQLRWTHAWFKHELPSRTKLDSYSRSIIFSCLWFV
jgi:hypothetical protein